MFGVLVNTLSIIVCSIIGLVVKKLINERIESCVMQALGLCVLIVGIIDAINPVSGTAGSLVLIISFAVGTIIGSALNIEKGFEKLGFLMENGFNKLFKIDAKENKTSTFAEGFTGATMIFCIGAMVIYGSISAGLGDNKTLLIKAVLDGVVAMLLTVKFGIGVIFSAIPVLIIQGAIAGASTFVGEFLLNAVNFKQELTAIGGVFVMAIGINLLEIKKIKIANMLPALFGACYFLVF